MTSCSPTTYATRKRVFKTEVKKVGLDTLKTIRNGIAFHCTEYLSDPDALTQTYRQVDAMTVEALRRIHLAAIDCGYAMRNVIVESIGR